MRTSGCRGFFLSSFHEQFGASIVWIGSEMVEGTKESTSGKAW
jgi:hypothetical protein